MRKPAVIVRYFNEIPKHGLPRDTWTRLAKTLAHSVHEHCHGWTLDLAEIPPSPDLSSPKGSQGNVDNTRKLDAWAQAVERAADGDRILLLDADTLIRRELDDVWDHPFDLAYTKKPEEARYPFNGGVIFLRVSDLTRAFIRTWRDVNRFFLEHPSEHDVWLPAFGGINQSAFGMLVESISDKAWPEPFKGYHPGLAIRKLPCLEWNCEDEHWDEFDPDRTRIVHYKSGLQRAIFGITEDAAHHKGLVSEWRAAAAASKREAQMATRPDRNMQITPAMIETPEAMPDSPEPEILTREQEREPVSVAVGHLQRMSKAERRRRRKEEA